MIATPDYDALTVELGDPTLTSAELDDALDALEPPEIPEAHSEDGMDEGVIEG